MPKFINLIGFLQKFISKEQVVVIMEFPDWVQVKMKILQLSITVIGYNFNDSHHTTNSGDCFSTSFTLSLPDTLFGIF